MTRISRKWIVGTVVLLSVGSIAVVLEFDRRRRLNEHPRHLSQASGRAVTGPADLALQFADSNRFQEFCLKVNEKYLRMNARYKSSQHRRRQRSRQVDSNGKALADEDLVEFVDFQNGIERHRTVEQFDRIAERKIEGESPLQKSLAVGKAPFTYAFSPESKWNDFEYKFVGVEVLDGVVVIKLEYTPNPPFGRKIAGTVWADAETGQPIRFHGRWFKPSFGIDKYEMAVKYGVSENGEHQIRSIEIDGAGGALIFTRHYLINIEFDDYRPPERR